MKSLRAIDPFYSHAFPYSIALATEYQKLKGNIVRNLLKLQA